MENNKAKSEAWPSIMCRPLVYSRPHVLLTIDGTTAGQFVCAKANSESHELANEAGNFLIMSSVGSGLLAKHCQQ